MLNFEKVVIYTGQTQRTSQKTGKVYTLISFLGEDGQTIQTMTDCNIPDLKVLDKIKVKLTLILGKYTSLTIRNIEKVN